MTKPLLVTMGDPAGIGGEILLRAAQDERLKTGQHPLIVIDDPERLIRLNDALSIGTRIHVLGAGDEVPTVPDSTDDDLYVWPLPMAVKATPGKPSIAYAEAILASIDRAVAGTLSGSAAALITNPIAKDILLQAGFRHPGHTEYLGQLAAIAGYPVKKAVMMLAGPSLRTVPVTVHIPLANVPLILRSELIVDTAEIVAADLKKRFGIEHPRLAISALNPHAGENGLMGDEDNREIKPAIAELKARGIDATGPYPADTLFETGKRQHYDVALCMYHDQALIPVKTLDMSNTVNVTLGLPFIRTSPDHGTAFDIAGKGIAKPDSLISAINMAAHLADQATGNASENAA
jgi:4-hydroxythreonine-4-phosphate dehydrogenase